MDEIAIQVDGVSKDFVLPHEKVTSVKSAFTGIFRHNRSVERQHALKDISFDIKKGEFFGIVGRNGSGKSTLLKILAGIYQPTRGSISVQGKLVPFIELGVGFNPELTGRENVYLNGAMMGFSEKEVDAMYDNIVDFAELQKFMDQKLKNYSSGMQVRLAFSMATRAKADVLLIDEVLAVGDADFQRKCFEYFKLLKRNKKTVVFVSHDMSAVREYCNRALLLESSEIMAIGRTDEIAQKYTQLFNEAPATSPTTRGNRWGNQEVSTKGVKAKDGGGVITIEHTFRSGIDSSMVIPGIRIRDAAGNEVLGTNIKHEGLSPLNLRAKHDVTVNWSLPNILSDGTYLVDVALINNDETTVYEWFDEAATLSVRKPKHVPYPIDPGYKVTIN